MQPTTSHQTAGYVGRLQRPTFSWRMGCKIARDRNENVPALVSITPRSELPDSGLQHLIGMKACVFAESRMRERSD